MGLFKNLAETLSAIKRERRLSTTNFAVELDISRSALQEYLEGKGNPRLSTIFFIAEKLNMDPAVLIFGETTNEALAEALTEQEQKELLVRLMGKYLDQMFASSENGAADLLRDILKTVTSCLDERAAETQAAENEEK